MEAHPDDAPRRNLELKSRCRNLAQAREAVLQLGARDGAVLEQTDTYFHCSSGRLKLRETAGRGAELIAYARPDLAEVRASEYHLAPVDHPVRLKQCLASALGVRVLVVKRRELLIWHNVRIHLDDVEGLGTFVELEAVMGPSEDEAVSEAHIKLLAAALSLQPDDYIASSYGDLMQP